MDKQYNEDNIDIELARRLGIETEEDYQEAIAYQAMITDVTGSLGCWGVSQR